jgi:hypothetical protein
MFRDLVYEEMDDISKMIEPFEYNINNEMANFPDQIEITINDVLRTYNSRWGWEDLSAITIVEKKAEELGLTNLAKMHSYDLRKMFKFKIEDLGDDEEISIDLENNTLSHKVFIVKEKFAFEEDELDKKVKGEIENIFRRGFNRAKYVNKSRMNEVAGIFGAKEVRSERGYRGKVHKLKKRINDLINDRTLNIKDYDLNIKFARWIVSYVRDGDLKAIRNLTTIKVMMHENKPIYSIQEL